MVVAVAAANSWRDNTPSPFASSALKTSSVVGWAAAYDTPGAVIEVTVGIAAGAVAEVDTTIGPLGGGGDVTRGDITYGAEASVAAELTVARLGRERVRTFTAPLGGCCGIGKWNCVGCVSASGAICCCRCTLATGGRMGTVYEPTGRTDSASTRAPRGDGEALVELPQAAADCAGPARPVRSSERRPRSCPRSFPKEPSVPPITVRRESPSVSADEWPPDMMHPALQERTAALLLPQALLRSKRASKASKRCLEAVVTIGFCGAADDQTSSALAVVGGCCCQRGVA